MVNEPGGESSRQKSSVGGSSSILEVVATFRIVNGQLIRREGCRTPSPPKDPGGSRSGSVPPSRAPAAPSSSSDAPPPPAKTVQVQYRSRSSWSLTKCPCGNYARGAADGLFNACSWATPAAPSSNTARKKLVNKKLGKKTNIYMLNKTTPARVPAELVFEEERFKYELKFLRL